MSEMEIIGYESLASFDNSERYARLMDKRDPLAGCRERFIIPEHAVGEPAIYLAGNRLGLQPVKARDYVNQELADWANLDSDGYFSVGNAGQTYDERLSRSMARLAGALAHEVVVMNSLTINLHLLMVTFYRPDKIRSKILIEGGAFPAHRYAVVSQLKNHGLDPSDCLLEVCARENEYTLRTEDIISVIENEGDNIALVLMSHCNDLTGQAFNIPAIAAAAHNKGCLLCVDVSAGVGNLDLRLHDWDVDFAVWCGYKYLNAGPGAVGGCFVNEKYAADFERPRLSGWFGQDRETRALAGSAFQPARGAEGFQVSCPSVLQLAGLKASLDIFDKVGMSAVRKKGDLLTGYLEFLLCSQEGGCCTLITPHNIRERGSQLSFKVAGDAKELLQRLRAGGAICDLKEPDVLRVAPVPLYNTFIDVYRFARLVAEHGGR